VDCGALSYSILPFRGFRDARSTRAQLHVRGALCAMISHSTALLEEKAVRRSTLLDVVSFFVPKQGLCNDVTALTGLSTGLHHSMPWCDLRPSFNHSPLQGQRRKDAQELQHAETTLLTEYPMTSIGIALHEHSALLQFYDRRFSLLASNCSAPRRSKNTTAKLQEKYSPQLNSLPRTGSRVATPVEGQRSLG